MFTPFAFVKSAIPAGPVLPPVTANLAIYLTTYETNSYPGTGTTWYDISGNSINFSMVGSPSLISQGGYDWFFCDGILGVSGNYFINTANFTSGLPAALNIFNEYWTCFYVVSKNPTKNFSSYSALASIDDNTNINNDYDTYTRHSIQGTSDPKYTRQYYKGGINSYTGIDVSADTNPHIISYRCNGTIAGEQWKVGTDGAENTANINTAPFDVSTVRKVAVGHNAAPSYDTFDGNIAEVIWYNSYLSDTNYNSVISYLKTRYGIA
jgi:hypothetical protein